MKDEIKDKIILKQDEPIADIEDLKQYVTNLLYAAYYYSAELIAFDKWAEERINELGEFLKSHELGEFLKSQLAKAGEEKPIIKKCRQCSFLDLDEHCEPCESCYPIAYSNWQPR